MRQDVLDKARDDPRGTAARLLDAAEEIFADRGYAGASTREIARRAQVPFGALHYYWGSKRELRKAVMKRLVDRMRETIAANLVPAGTPGEILDNMTDAFVEVFASSRNVARLLYRNMLEPPEARAEDLWAELSEFGIGILRQHGLDKHIDAPVALLLVSNAFLGTMVDESGQERACGATVFRARRVRERFRTELRRLNRAAFAVE